REPTTRRMRSASCSSYAIGILLLTVSHLLAVMARVEFHEAHVVLYGHGAEDGRSHPLAVRGGLPAGLSELLVGRLEANASLARRRWSARRVHRLAGLRLRKCRLSQHPLEQEDAGDRVNDCGELWKLRHTASRHVGRLLERAGDVLHDLAWRPLPRRTRRRPGGLCPLAGDEQLLHRLFA